MSSNYTLTTERLGLRKWTADDLAPFAAINSDPVVMRHFPTILSREKTERFVRSIQEHFTQHGYGLYAVDLLANDAFIGFVGLNWATFSAHFTPCVEIGWRLATQYWGKGYATEAARACLKYGFTELDLPEICSFTATENTNSVAVMERIGLRYRGNFGHPRIDPGHRLHPHVLYLLRQGEYDGSDR